MDKKVVLVRVALVFALIAGLLSITPAMAQGGQAFTSGIQVANLETTPATISLAFYSEADGSLVTTVGDTISGNGSKTYFPIQAPAGFKGSMVISSDKKVAAIANTVTTDYLYSASTTSFDAGATKVNIPLVMCSNNFFFTFFSIQNTGTADATVTVSYLAGDSGLNYTAPSITIKPGASKMINQESMCTADKLGTRFVGSALATSTNDQPIVATVMQMNVTNFKVLMGYNGFVSGSSAVALPLVMANNSGYYTGIQVQNAGDAATTVTIDYGPNTSGSFDPANDTCTLDPGKSCTLIQSGASGTKWGPDKGRYIGSATVNSTGNAPLVAIVNQVTPAGQGTAYEGFDPALATSDINAPLIMANNSGYYTGYQLQNVGASVCPSVTVDYSANTVSSTIVDPTNDTVTNLAAGASQTFIQSGGQWNARYIGSAKFNAPGCQIVAIINQVAIKSADAFMTYDGFNYTP